MTLKYSNFAWFKRNFKISKPFYLLTITLKIEQYFIGGNNGILAIFHFPVRKSITAPPRGPSWAAGICISLVIPAVPKLLWATPQGLGKALHSSEEEATCLPWVATRVGGAELSGG